ncbi:MAG: hypothetical protein J2P22_04685 [Nocardioides sp.]|nr:hypothetical protein [Nocardioides sp.]
MGRWSGGGAKTTAVLTVLAGLTALVALQRRRARSPNGLRSQYRRGVAAALTASPPERQIISEDDLTHLPAPVARYVRRSGAVGRPAVTGFRVTLRGRIRSAPGGSWMPFTGEQVNTYGPHPTRHFWLDAKAYGVPLDVLHVLTEGHATMRADVLSAVRVVDASGPEMDKAESVTLFNDLCLFAPAGLLHAPITWSAVDDCHARGMYHHGDYSVTAMLEFDADGDLLDFVSDDRLRDDGGGGSFTQMRWSTPVSSYASADGRRYVSHGSAVWHAPPPGTPYTYVELEVVSLQPNPAPR